MSTVTSINDRPTVPPWLDLDAIVEPELRQRIGELTESGRVLGAQVREWAIEAYKASRDYYEALRVVGDHDLGDLLSPLAGYDKLFDVAADMSEDAGVLEGGPAKPRWVDEVDPSRIGKEMWQA